MNVRCVWKYKHVPCEGSVWICKAKYFKVREVLDEGKYFKWKIQVWEGISIKKLIM